MANDKQASRCFWLTVDYGRLNPFPNYAYRFLFDALMLAGGLSFVYICVMTGIVR